MFNFYHTWQREASPPDIWVAGRSKYSLSLFEKVTKMIHQLSKWSVSWMLQLSTLPCYFSHPMTVLQNMGKKYECFVNKCFLRYVFQDMPVRSEWEGGCSHTLIISDNIQHDVLKFLIVSEPKPKDIIVYCDVRKSSGDSNQRDFGTFVDLDDQHIIKIVDYFYLSQLIDILIHLWSSSSNIPIEICSSFISVSAKQSTVFLKQ